MIATIKSLSKFYYEISIIIDGIDECLRPTELCNILSKLAATTNIKVLATSRHERDIAEAFSDIPQLIMEDSAIQADIGTYIDWRLEHDGCLRQAKSDLKQHIKKRLLTENGGMYFLPICQKLIALVDSDGSNVILITLEHLTESLQGGRQ